MADDKIQGQLDEHARGIQELSEGQRMLGAQVESHEEQFRDMNRESSKNAAEIKTQLENVGKDVKTVLTDFHERVGQRKLTRWIGPLIVTIISVAFSIAVALAAFVN